LHQEARRTQLCAGPKHTKTEGTRKIIDGVDVRVEVHVLVGTKLFLGLVLEQADELVNSILKT
jgi:hypothetical protein